MTDQTTSYDKSAVLKAFSRAIVRETQVLTNQPNLLWQQLYNRLQWEKGPVFRVLQPEFARRTKAGAQTWIRRVTPLHESPGLRLTLTADAPWVSVAFSPDNTFIFSIDGKVIRVWNAKTGVEQSTLTGHTGDIEMCAISPDGSTIVSSSRDGTVRIWDAKTGTQRATLVDKSHWVEACAISPDGSFIIAGSIRVAGPFEDEIHIWDAKTGLLRAKSPVRDLGPIRVCSISPDGTYIVVSCDWETVILDVQTATTRFVLKGEIQPVISADGSFVVTASQDKALRIWDPSTGAQRAVLCDGESQFKPVISSDGSFVVAGSNPSDQGRLEDKSAVTLKIWDVAKGTVRANLDSQKKTFTTWAISPDNSFVVSGDEDNKLKVWDPETGAERLALVGHTRKVTACAVSPDGSLVLSGSADQTIRVWDLESSETPIPVDAFGNIGGNCTFSGDGSFTLSGTKGDLFRIHDARSGMERAAFASSVAAFAPVISPDSSFVVFPFFDEKLKTWHGFRLWDSRTGVERVILDEDSDEIDECIITPDGSFIVSGNRDGALKVWNAKTGTLHAILSDENSPCAYPKISPDGSFVVAMLCNLTRHRRDELRIWDIKTGIARATLRGHVKDINELEISLDNSLIVSEDVETIRIWNAMTGTRRATLQGDFGAPSGPDFMLSPNGVYFLTSCLKDDFVNSEYEVKVWSSKRGTERNNLPGQTLPVISPDGSLFVTTSTTDRNLTVTVWDAITIKERTKCSGNLILTEERAINTKCAISPDGSLIILAARGALKVWSAKSGREYGTLPVVSYPGQLALHPHRPVLALTIGGNIDLLEIVGVEYGPIIVTATRGEQGLDVRCPTCGQQVQIGKTQLGTELTCPQDGCNARLRVNPFVVGPMLQKKNWLSKLLKK